MSPLTYFTDFNSLIERKIYEFVSVKENGDVGLNPPPSEENHGHEQGWYSFLNINNNDIPDMVIVGTVISSENYGEAYVLIDNELKYRFDTGQAGTRKILIGDIDNNGSDDAVLVATGIDTQPYSGSPTQIIYFTPNSYEFVNLDDDPSYYHTGGIGDLNNDGLLDVGGAPGQWYENENKWSIKVFMQKQNMQFENRDIIFDYNETGHSLPFTLGFADLFGDEYEYLYKKY